MHSRIIVTNSQITNSLKQFHRQEIIFSEKKNASIILFEHIPFVVQYPWPFCMLLIINIQSKK